MNPFSTWTDLPCRCSESDRGSVIVYLRCASHAQLIEPERVERALLGAGGHLGPIPQPEGWAA